MSALNSFFIVNNIFSICVIVLLLVSCSEKEKPPGSSIPNPEIAKVEIPDITIHDSLLVYNNKVSQWTLDGQLYSGHAERYYKGDVLKEKFSLMNGKKQNQSIEWYADGLLKSEANYHNGKLHGEKKLWSPDTSHVLVSQLNYHLGKLHGEQLLWYTSGELYKKLNLNMGREEGMQQAFRKNGDLYANYEALEGRIFGLKKASLCYGLEEEKVNY